MSDTMITIRKSALNHSKFENIPTLFSAEYLENRISNLFRISWNQGTVHMHVYT